MDPKLIFDEHSGEVLGAPVLVEGEPPMVVSGDEGDGPGDLVPVGGDPLGGLEPSGAGRREP